MRMLLLAILLGLGVSSAPADADGLDPATLDRYAQLALRCVHQQYPNHLSLAVGSDADVMPPYPLHPSFYGCLDWHSSVHGHWLLARLLRLDPKAPYASEARRVLEEDLSPGRLAGEVQYFANPNRASFERPYGLAWLLTLAAELRRSDDPDARRWSAALAPLETIARDRLLGWIGKLHYPIRIGEHNQTAFSFGLVWDWADAVHDEAMLAALRDAAERFYARDRACPVSYEPSGEDFLSPCLAEADFMRRVLPAARYGRWLQAFLPGAGAPHFLTPAIVTDRSDPKLAHLDGLNLSRAWMLQGIATALPERDPRRAKLLALSTKHAAAALPAVTGEHYEGGHWLGTFAVYLLAR
jgi:Protein of unknown function (DUF2891)